MSCHATVIYPNTPDAKFDMEYYLKTHMPLVDENWKKYGLQGWTVTQMVANGDQQPKYSVQAVLTWESHAALAKALASEDAKVVFGDVPNFSNVEPVLLGGNVLASSGVMKI